MSGCYAKLNLFGTDVTIKAVVVDFDNTLCLHCNPGYYGGHEKLVRNFGARYYVDDNIVYDSVCHVKTPYMDEFLKDLRSEGIPIISLSHCYDSLELETKEKWLSKNYGVKFERVIGAGTRKIKLSTLSRIAIMKEIKFNELLFIDDNSDLRTKAVEKGYIVLSPEAVMTYQMSKEKEEV